MGFEMDPFPEQLGSRKTCAISSFDAPTPDRSLDQQLECKDNGVEHDDRARYIRERKETNRVHWDTHSREVYVDYAGRSYVGHASDAKEAMTKAEAWLYNK